jgi:hypothetical protein
MSPSAGIGMTVLAAPPQLIWRDYDVYVPDDPGADQPDQPDKTRDKAPDVATKWSRQATGTGQWRG